MKTTHTATAFVLLVSLALTGCVDRPAQEQARRTAEIVTDPSVAVRTVEAVAKDLERTLDITGRLVTDDDLQISAKLPGRLAAVYIQEGSNVTAGQLIAQQDTRDANAQLRQAQANVDAARAQLRQAQLDASVASQRSDAAVRAGEARLRSARAALERALAGARPEEKAQAKANVDRAKSDLDTARKAFERASRLFNEGAIAQAELEASQNRLDNAQAGYNAAEQAYLLVLDAVRDEDITQAREGVRQAEEALRLDRANQKLDPAAQDRVAAARAQVQAAEEGVRLARIALEELTIRAPMSGKITGKPLQAGTMVSPGVPIARLVGVQGVFFEADIPEREIAQVRPGMPVEAKIEALGDTVLTGTVQSLSPLASDLGRLFTVRVGFNESTNNLKPGMFVRGTIRLGTDSGAITVPSTSVRGDGEANYVYTVATAQKDGNSVQIAKRTPVRLVRTVGPTAVVEGLELGAQVVSVGMADLSDGALITIQKPAQTDSTPDQNRQQD